jgi:hypothetical protein
MLHAADSKFKRCFSFQGHVLVASEDRKVPSTIEHVPCFALSLGAIVTPNESSSTGQISESQNPIPRQQLGTVRMVSIVESTQIAGLGSACSDDQRSIYRPA